MKAAMYIFINQGLRMSPGKIAAQAGHAAVEAALLSHPAPDASTTPVFYGNLNSNAHQDQEALWDAWRSGGHYAKYVMAARDGDHLRDIETYLRARGFRTALILDEGHTEVPAISPTALGVALVDKDDPHTSATFGSFDLYREPRPPKPIDFSQPLRPLRPMSDFEIDALRKQVREQYSGPVDSSYFQRFKNWWKE